MKGKSMRHDNPVDHHIHHHHDGHSERGERAEGHRGGHGRHFGGPRGRARRGEARYVLLDALRDSPKHGYEIIRYLEERSSGEYAPSPGTVYPTMQYLEDLGQVRSDQGAERRIYHLTEAGQAELEARAEDLEAFWARFGSPDTSPANQPELSFLREEIDNLGRTVWSGLRSLMDRDDTETARRVRQAVERCRSEIREIIAQRAFQKSSSETKPPDEEAVPQYEDTL